MKYIISGMKTRKRVVLAGRTDIVIREEGNLRCDY
jgi:hypothetical protein